MPGNFISILLQRICLKKLKRYKQDPQIRVNNTHNVSTMLQIYNYF
jgi:hypothetical protein